MKNIILTSAGFENKNVKDKFLSLLHKDVKNAKVLFIITAAQDPGAIRILSECLDDLTLCNIPDENIRVYDLHRPLLQEEINRYDAIYVCGGKTEYLVERMSEVNFSTTVNAYLDQGGIYVGVSAGSICASGSYSNGLNFIANRLDVHCDVGTENGPITTEEGIHLTNNQAILISDSEKIIFE